MAYFNRFDICEAYYLYASHYHSGQSSEVYKVFGRLSKIGFKPSVSLSLSENGQEIYSALVEHGMRSQSRS